MQTELQEEAIIDLFGRYQRGEFSPQDAIKRLFIRLMKLLGALLNELRGAGFTAKHAFHEVFGE